MSNLKILSYEGQVCECDSEAAHAKVRGYRAIEDRNFQKWGKKELERNTRGQTPILDQINPSAGPFWKDLPSCERRPQLGDRKRQGRDGASAS